MKRLRGTGSAPLLIGPLLGVALLATGCGGATPESEPVQVTPGSGHGGAGMVPSEADPTEVTPGHPITGTGAAGTGATEVAPSGGASPNPQPMPDETPVSTPGLSPVDLLPGTRSRVASWRLAGREGARTLLLDVQVGGAPCDAVTALDVQESAGSVWITVHAGVVASADCGPGVPARLGTARVRAHLQRPLGTRRLLGG